MGTPVGEAVLQVVGGGVEEDPGLIEPRALDPRVLVQGAHALQLPVRAHDPWRRTTRGSVGGVSGRRSVRGGEWVGGPEEMKLAERNVSESFSSWVVQEVAGGAGGGGGVGGSVPLGLVDIRDSKPPPPNLLPVPRPSKQTNHTILGK